MEILFLSLKTLGFYLFLIFAMRIMGKREVGNLSVFDLAVYFTMSDLITMSIVDKNNEFWLPIISVSILVIMQLLLSVLSLKNRKFRSFLDGTFSIIIYNGVIDFEAMKKQRYSVDDLFTQIRDKGFDSPKLIKWAILETSGKLSVISLDISQSSYPDPIISDGQIIYESLKCIGKDEQWLYNELLKKNIKNMKNVKIALYCDNGLITF